MKIDRLIGILSILLQKEKVTAPLLAEKFQVSRRTINRDIEDLCKAGIPVMTEQGYGGGISIMAGYKLDKTLLTSLEMQAILTGLQSLDSVSGSNKYQQLMSKLSLSDSTFLASNSHILIDLSSYYKSSLTPKIELIQAAISARQLIGFDYYSVKGKSQRVVEPYLLVFQWSSWYVRGYCTEKRDYRLFKLNRMLDLINTGEHFEMRKVPEYEAAPEAVFAFNFSVLAIFDKETKWRLIEEYGPDSFQEQEDGTLLFQFGFTDKENLFSWLFSFGDRVELLEPKELRRELQDRAEKIRNKYR